MDILRMFGWQNCSGILGSVLAYGISFLDGKRGLSSWQWVYIIEGVATILFSGFIYWILPDWPKSERSKSWLTPREQEFLEARLSENAPRTHDALFNKEEIIASLTDLRTYAFMASQVLPNHPPLWAYELMLGRSWSIWVATDSVGTCQPSPPILDLQDFQETNF
jgi:MFS family permease